MEGQSVSTSKSFFNADIQCYTRGPVRVVCELLVFTCTCVAYGMLRYDCPGEGDAMDI